MARPASLRRIRAAGSTGGGGQGGAPHKKRPETGTGQSSLCDGFGTDIAQAGIGSGSDTDAIRGTVLPGKRIVTAC